MSVLRVLLVEDDASYAAFVTSLMKEARPPVLLTAVPSLARAIETVGAEPCDAVLLDLGLPDSQGVATVTRVRHAAPDLPVVVLTGESDEGLAAAALQGGAQDYLEKKDVDAPLLLKTLRFAVERQRIAAELRDSARRQRFLNAASGVLSAVGFDVTLEAVANLTVSSVADLCIIVLVSDDATIEENHVAHRDPRQAGLLRAAERAAMAEIGRVPALSAPHGMNGHARLLSEITPATVGLFATAGEAQACFEGLGLRSAIRVPLVANGRFSGFMTVASAGPDRIFDGRDVALFDELGRRVALTIENRRLLREARELFDADLTGNFVATIDGVLLACNSAFARMLGFASPEEARGTAIVPLFSDRAEWPALLRRVRDESGVRQREIVLRTREGELVHALVSATGFSDGRGRLFRVRGQLSDLTTHKRLEEQLGHSQRLEAVGRLAGGIAHDFNNLMLVIGGHTERLLERLPPGAADAADLQAIARATERAAGLTQQLLAFSRRQVLSMRVLSINDVIVDVYGMLARLIGEDVICSLSLAPGIHNVRADPGRLGQVFMNLAVNARDAMPRGGTLRISTANVDLDEAYSRQHLNAHPGPYVMIAVSDTGCGMDAQTRARVFEPFFTTKPPGKGTGLGLATVYGIVKQLGGYVWVYSEPGLGTTFKIYLPVVDEAAPEWRQAPKVEAEASRGETILLVEDEEPVRELLEELLVQLGYQVLSADCGVAALETLHGTAEPIHLLVTDVVMPGMSGRELAMRITGERPDVRVLYLSGYTDDVISHHGVLEPGAAFLQKPFTRAELARKVREALAMPDHR